MSRIITNVAFDLVIHPTRPIKSVTVSYLGDDGKVNRAELNTDEAASVSSVWVENSEIIDAVTAAVEAAIEAQALSALDSLTLIDRMSLARIAEAEKATALAAAATAKAELASAVASKQTAAADEAVAVASKIAAMAEKDAIDAEIVAKQAELARILEQIDTVVVVPVVEPVVEPPVVEEPVVEPI